VSHQVQPARYTFRLSTTDADVTDIDPFYPANSKEFRGEFYDIEESTPFFSRVDLTSTTMGHGDFLDIFGTTQFTYDASMGDNLLLDITISAVGDGELPNFQNWHNYSRTLYFDSNPTTYGTFSRAYQVALASSDQQPQGKPAGDYWDDWGLTTEFGFGPAGPQTVIPEPMTIVLLATGLVGIAGAARRRRQRGVSDDC